MNYKEMSWHEINMAVTCIAHNCEGWSVSESNMSFYHCGPDGKGWEEVEVVDYSNPENAWPIMIKNNIGVCHYDLDKSDKDHDKWFALSDSIVDIDEYPVDTNPLRAAMICFLKMKDAENETIN